MCLWPEDFISKGVLWMNKGELKASAGPYCLPAISFLRNMIADGYDEERIMSAIDRMIAEENKNDPVYQSKVLQLKGQAKKLLKSKKIKREIKEVKKFFGPAGS